MYISLPELIIFSILGILYFIGMYIYAQQCGHFWYKKYDELNESHQKLYKEYKELYDEKFLNNIQKNNENEKTFSQDEENNNECQICHSTKNVHYYATDGYIKNNDSKTFLSGGFHMCDNCLNACEQCECGKLKTPFFLTKYIGDVMQNNKFCNCEEAPDEKKERFRREYFKYEQNCYKARKND